MFDSVQVDLQGVSLLEQAGRDALINFANSGVGYIDYESYLAEVSSPGRHWNMDFLSMFSLEAHPGLNDLNCFCCFS